MKVLVVGGGGREHALCWAIAASPLCEALYCTPGNAGIAKEATCVPIPAEDVEGLLAFALSLIHISEPTRPVGISRMPSSA